MNIKEFKVGQTITDQMLIKVVSKLLTAAQKEYYQVFFQDCSGEIKGFVWDAKKVNFEPKNGDLVNVTAVVEEYKGSMQLRISELTKFDGEIDMSKFYKVAPINIDETKFIIKTFIAEINDFEIRTLVDTIYTKYEDKFYIWPAAKTNHHEMRSGLAFHTRTMLELAKSILSVYQINNYLESKIDSDYVYAAIILHDMCKTVEMDWEPTTEYTVKGKLLGHISMMSSEILGTGKELGVTDEKVTLLAHCILSHHGKLEYGSPVLPLTIEADFVNMLDNLDARLTMCSKALADIDEGESWTKRIFGLEQRSLYKHD